MPIKLEGAAGQRRDLARRLKAAFDDLQEADSGWYYVDLDHPAWGRDAAGPMEARIPGVLVIDGDEPGNEADALVVAVGFIDDFTGEAKLGNGMVLPGLDAGALPRNDDRNDYPSQRLPAVALYEEHGSAWALIGTIHQTRESRFEAGGLTHEAAAAITEWLRERPRDRDA